MKIEDNMGKKQKILKKHRKWVTHPAIGTLSLAVCLPLLSHTRDLHPLDNAHAEHIIIGGIMTT